MDASTIPDRPKRDYSEEGIEAFYSRDEEEYYKTFPLETNNSGYWYATCFHKLFRDFRKHLGEGFRCEIKEGKGDIIFEVWCEDWSKILCSTAVGCFTLEERALYAQLLHNLREICRENRLWACPEYTSGGSIACILIRSL